MNPTPLKSIYVWTKLFFFPLEYDGWVAYVEGHPKILDPPLTTSHKHLGTKISLEVPHHGQDDYIQLDKNK